MPAILRKISIDAAIAMTMIQRIWGVGAGLVMVLLTSTLFSREMQGYYYTFNSLIALQAFFELGLNFVLVQFVSHDIVKLDGIANPRERQAAIDRIGLLYLSVRRWFAVSALLFAVAIGAGGLIFLSQEATHVPLAEWVGAWLLIVAAAAVNLYFSPQLAIAEGTGKVAQIARLRTLQSMAGYLTCWILILIHPTLLAVAAIGIASAVSNGWWIRRHSDVPGIAAQVSPQGTGYQWRHDILPLQWKIGLSWMSGYLLYQVFTPLTFAHRSAAEAAMIGLSIAMFSNISLIAMSWLSASTPALSGMVARGERGALRRRFRTLFLQSFAFQLAACVGLCIVVEAGRRVGLPVMDRFLPVGDLALLGATSCCNMVIFALATFMRIHKEEPMLWNSLICGALVAGVTWFTSFHGAHAVVFGYFIVILGISLPWAGVLFRRYWHRDTKGAAPVPA